MNIAEISQALDLAGNPASDVDSTPNDIIDNDNGGVPFTNTDDQLNGTGLDDEDDHDHGFRPNAEMGCPHGTRIRGCERKEHIVDGCVFCDRRIQTAG